MTFSQLKRRIKKAYLAHRFHLDAQGDAFEIGKYCIFRRNDQGRIILGQGFGARNFVTFNVSGRLEFGERVFVNSRIIQCAGKYFYWRWHADWRGRPVL